MTANEKVKERSSRSGGSGGDSVQKSAQNVHSFAAKQGGHVTRAQLEQSGLAARTVADWVSAGKLIRVYRGVYAVGHLQSNPINAAHAALLAGGPRSALTGPCALVLWGIWRHWPKRLEVVMAVDRRPTGLVVHHSATLLKRDITIVQGLRVTSPARTMLDNAGRLKPEQRTRAVNDLRLRDLLTIDQLADVIARNPTHPAVSLLQSELEFAQPEPTRSVLEDRFLPMLRRHKLPIPLINVDVAGYRVDAYFPDHALIVELDGWKTHRSKVRFLGDRRQDFAILAATGIPTVRLPYDDVNDATIVKLGRLLEQRGVRGLKRPYDQPLTRC